MFAINKRGVGKFKKSYEEVCKIFLDNGCALLVPREEFITLPHNARLTYKCICGRIDESVIYIFVHRKMCKICESEQQESGRKRRREIDPDIDFTEEIPRPSTPIPPTMRSFETPIPPTPINFDIPTCPITPRRFVTPTRPPPTPIRNASVLLNAAQMARWRDEAQTPPPFTLSSQ